MKKGILNKIDALDVEDFLKEIEASYNISFKNTDTIYTFGEFVDIVEKKLKQNQAAHKDDCTSQHLFYALRKEITKISDFEMKNLTPKTPLADIFPYFKRKKQVKQLEKAMNIKIDLDYPLFVGIFFLLSLILTFILSSNLFSILFIGSLLINFISFGLMILLSNHFKDRTLGQLVKRIEREQYSAIQKVPNTYRLSEIEQNLSEHLRDYFQLGNIKIDRNTLL